MLGVISYAPVFSPIHSHGLLAHSIAGPRSHWRTAGYADAGKSCLPTSFTTRVALAPAALAASQICWARGRDLALLDTMRNGLPQVRRAAWRERGEPSV